MLTDIDDYPMVNDAYGAYFVIDPPARSTFGKKQKNRGGLLFLLLHEKKWARRRKL